MVQYGFFEGQFLGAWNWNDLHIVCGTWSALGCNPTRLQCPACTRDCSYSVSRSPSTFSKGWMAIFSNFDDVPQLLASS